MKPNDVGLKKQQFHPEQEYNRPGYTHEAKGTGFSPENSIFSREILSINIQTCIIIRL